MKRILFVTNRNVLTTCGELRLIKNRAEFLYKTYDIATDFIVWGKKSRITSVEREYIYAGGMTSEYSFSFEQIYKMVITYKEILCEIEKKLRSKEYCAVVISGPVLPILARKLKKRYKIDVILDIHGAQEDHLEVANGKSFKRRCLANFLYHTDRFSLKIALKVVDGCFVVTKALEEYIKKMYSINNNIKFFIVPCAPNLDEIHPIKYIEKRKIYRDRYNLADDELAFVYSGGMSAWQCIEETISLYKSLSQKIDLSSKLLIFSHNIDDIKSMIEGEDSIIVDSYKPDELKYALYLGDFAFLLRRDCATNNVAFPNKFLEYIASGMKVISTPYVYEIAGQPKFLA